MSVGKSSIKRVGTAETKTAPVKVAEEPKNVKPAVKTVKKTAAKKTAPASKAVSKAKNGAVLLTEELPYYLL